jgi:hypothetical protein
MVASRIYRGQRDTTWLLSSVFERWLLRWKGEDPASDLRLFGAGAFDRIRDAYREQFKHVASVLPGVLADLEPDDWWILGRHHGLVTPLLDWSESPYVAAFFAFMDYLDYANPGFKDGLATLGLGRGGSAITYGEGHVAVWSLALADGVAVPDEFSVIAPQIPFAPYSARVRAQASMFTRLDHGVHLDVESHLRSRGIAHFLECFEIPTSDTAEAITDLRLMNISFATLFPDFDGAARQANLANALAAFGLTSAVEYRRR